MESIRCTACGYVTNDTRDRNCVRCNTPLEGLPEPVAPPPRPTPKPRPVAAPKRRGGLVVLAVTLALVAATAVGIVAFYFLVVKPRSDARPSQAELKRLLTTQPDFQGEADFVEGKETYSGVIARKGDHMMMGINFSRSLLMRDPSRSGMTPINAIFKPGKPILIVIPEFEAYAEVPAGTQGLPKEDPISQVFTILGEETCEVEEYGPSAVGQYQTVKYKITSTADGRNPGFISVAPALRNLIVEVDLGPDWTVFKGRLRYTIKNAALEVNNDLFRVPVTYNKVK